MILLIIWMITGELCIQCLRNFLDPDPDPGCIRIQIRVGSGFN
jgi:hypothetical protein